jgi:hypothetical protein
MHFRPAQRRDHPPLDATFFRRAARHAPKTVLEQVVSQGKAVGQLDLFRDDPPVSLEEHLGRLYFELQNTGTDVARQAYFELVGLYHRELLKTTNWMIGRSGPMKKLLVAELRAGRQISIVTFNHDLLAENALSLLPTHWFPSRWCISHAYGIGGVEQIANSDAEFDSDCPGDESLHIPVLKLHGSANWVFRTRDPYPPGNFGRGSRRKLFLWTNKMLPDRIGVKLRTQGPGRDWYLWPLIVPPIYEKHGLIRHELERVWRKAGSTIEEADRVIFWGLLISSS